MTDLETEIFDFLKFQIQGAKGGHNVRKGEFIFMSARDVHLALGWQSEGLTETDVSDALENMLRSGILEWQALAGKSGKNKKRYRIRKSALNQND